MAAGLHPSALLLPLLMMATPVLAHHSYADYDSAERYVLHGTITEIHWGNPHILFMIHSDTGDMRVEWVTLTGAEKTAVTKQQFAVGDQMVVVGSRNNNPQRHIMTLVKELRLPAKHWRWQSPSLSSLLLQPAPGQ